MRGRRAARLAWAGAAGVGATSCAATGLGAWALACALLGAATLLPRQPLPLRARSWALGGWVGTLGVAVILGVPVVFPAGALALAARQLEAHGALAARVARVDPAVSRRAGLRALASGSAAWGASLAGAAVPAWEGFWGSLGWMALALLALGVLARLARGPSPEGARR